MEGGDGGEAGGGSDAASVLPDLCVGFETSVDVIALDCIGGCWDVALGNLVVDSNSSKIRL